MSCLVQGTKTIVHTNRLSPSCKKKQLHISPRGEGQRGVCGDIPKEAGFWDAVDNELGIQGIKCVCVCACGSHREILSVFFKYSLLYFSRQGLSQYLKLSD